MNLDGNQTSIREVCDAGCSLYPVIGPDGHCDRSRNAGRDYRFELILQRFHG